MSPRYTTRWDELVLVRVSEDPFVPGPPDTMTERARQ